MDKRQPPRGEAPKVRCSHCGSSLEPSCALELSGVYFLEKAFHPGVSRGIFSFLCCVALFRRLRPSLALPHPHPTPLPDPAG